MPTEKGPDHPMQQIESVIESEPLDVLSTEVVTPTRRRSTRSVLEVVLPSTTRAKAKASRRFVSLAEESTSVNEEQHPPTQAATPSPSKQTVRLKTTRVTKKKQPQETKPEREEEDGDEDDEEEVSTLVVSSPSRRTSLPEFDPSMDLSGPLPSHLLFCFNTYKRAILKTLHCPNIASSQTDSPSVNDIAAKQLRDLVDGTVLRAEGNSCLLLGPRGSGKSQVRL
jgi:origin recognition complex subunit 4